MKAKLIRNKLKGTNGSTLGFAPKLLPLALIAKLHEEAQEIAEDIRNPEEYADMFQALEDLMAISGVNIDEVKKIQAKKYADRGGFSAGKIMRVPFTPLQTESKEGSE